jgi:hypothetical protein
MPVDMQPGALDKPVAVVYDLDGAATDALIGTGVADCALRPCDRFSRQAVVEVTRAGYVLRPARAGELNQRNS